MRGGAAFSGGLTNAVSTQWSSRVSPPLHPRVLRDQICTTFGPEVKCARQVDVMNGSNSAVWPQGGYRVGKRAATFHFAEGRFGPLLTKPAGFVCTCTRYRVDLRKRGRGARHKWLCSGAEAGSNLRLIDFVYHSTLGLRVTKKKKKTRAGFA